MQPSTLAFYVQGRDEPPFGYNHLILFIVQEAWNIKLDQAHIFYMVEVRGLHLTLTGKDQY